MSFAQRLSQLLEDRELSAYRVSKDTGLSTGLLSLYRTGKNDPSAENIIKLATYFDVSADYLLGLSNSPERQK